MSCLPPPPWVPTAWVPTPAQMIYPTMTSNDIKQRLKAAMEKRATTITGFLKELHREGKTKH
eukprot:2704074-Prymnesium_polylepis.1